MEFTAVHIHLTQLEKRQCQMEEEINRLTKAVGSLSKQLQEKSSASREGGGGSASSSSSSALIQGREDGGRPRVLFVSKDSVRDSHDFFQKLLPEFDLVESDPEHKCGSCIVTFIGFARWDQQVSDARLPEYIPSSRVIAVPQHLTVNIRTIRRVKPEGLLGYAAVIPVVIYDTKQQEKNHTSIGAFVKPDPTADVGTREKFNADMIQELRKKLAEVSTK